MPIFFNEMVSEAQRVRQLGSRKDPELEWWVIRSLHLGLSL